jgi:hypothetical protein
MCEAFGKMRFKFIKLSLGEVANVMDDSMSWKEPMIIDEEYISNCCGYPSIVKVDDGKYFFVHAKEIDENDADTWGGYLRLE